MKKFFLSCSILFFTLTSSFCLGDLTEAIQKQDDSAVGLWFRTHGRFEKGVDKQIKEALMIRITKGQDDADKTFK
ncbi:MAG: hypothetical protein V1855_00910, partial [bacterium]